ncbi:MAG: hypothetical protein WB660_08065 [Candidatus Sulfotelmatobacter sp.]
MASKPALLLSRVTVIALSTIVFALMQLMFGGSHCYDCGARVGFPLSYMQDGTYGTHGRFLWLGFIGDIATAATITISVMSMWHRRKVSK